LPSAMRRLYWSQSLTSGCDQRVCRRSQSVGADAAQASAIALVSQ
jgi:hypothetical protein